jgi:hypothetical protein
LLYFVKNKVLKMKIQPLVFSIFLLLTAIALTAGPLPFNHWLNDYYYFASKSGKLEKDNNSGVWPPHLQNTSLLKANASPPWFYPLLENYALVRLSALNNDSWDYTDIGLSLSSGYRDFAASKSLTYSPSVQTWVQFRPHLRAFIRVRGVNDTEGIQAFSGNNTGRDRASFAAAEADYMYLEYTTSVLNARFGRMRHGWSLGPTSSLLLNPVGPSYDGLSADIGYRNFRLHFFSSFLESEASSDTSFMTHRYLSGHYLTFTASRLQLAVGETILYAGKNRPMDIVYAIPLMTYVEADYNGRFNHPGMETDNAFLYITGRYRFGNNISLYGSFVVDEFQIDAPDREKYPDATAFRAGMDVPIGPTDCLSIATFEYVRVGSWTYRYHQNFGNYSSRGLLLGWPNGSDLEKVNINVTSLIVPGFIFSSDFYALRSGEQNILYNDLPSLLSKAGAFPNGVVESRFGWRMRIQYQSSPNLRVGLNGIIQKVENEYNVQGRDVVQYQAGVFAEYSLGFSIYK